MTNPNVPANQADAAKSSAPDAKVMPSQPVQTGQASQATPTPAPAANVPVDANQRMQSTANLTQDQKDLEAARKLQADRGQNAKETAKSESTEASANQNDDYFQKVADDDKIAQGKDPFREQARLERQREEDLGKGDPTRDPAAKQAAMDMNTPAPGAKEEAEAMNKGTHQ